MTRYEKGFLTKCAEYGVDGRAMLKKAGLSISPEGVTLSSGLKSPRGIPVTTYTTMAPHGILNTGVFGGGAGAIIGGLSTKDKEKRKKRMLIGALLGSVATPAAVLGGAHLVDRSTAGSVTDATVDAIRAIPASLV